MRTKLAALISLAMLLGCFGESYAPLRPVNVAYENPAKIPIANPDLVWDGVTDVVSQYFRIEREDPVRKIGQTLTCGRIDTFPMPGGTLLEPWYHDSANTYEQLESTLQSIRRYAIIKVLPNSDGSCYWVEVAVYKELEDLRQPEHATAGSAVFRNDVSLAPRTAPDQPVGKFAQKWIPQGRDTAAEQRIIGQLLDRFTPAGTPVPVN